NANNLEPIERIGTSRLSINNVGAGGGKVGPRPVRLIDSLWPGYGEYSTTPGALCTYPGSGPRVSERMPGDSAATLIGKGAVSAPIARTISVPRPRLALAGTRNAILWPSEKSTWAGAVLSVTVGCRPKLLPKMMPDDPGERFEGKPKAFRATRVI